MDLQHIRPQKHLHYAAIVDLTAKAFTMTYWEWQDYCQNGYLCDSHYDWQASTIGLHEKQIITHWGVWGYRMRIGKTSVKIAGIGAVATDGKFRKRGLMRQTVQAGIEAARRRKYDMSILFGIDNFYHKFDYVRAWPEQTYIVDIEHLATGSASRLFSVLPQYQSQIATCYNRYYAGLTGSAVHPTYQQRKQWQQYLWKNANGKVAGYIVIDKTPDKLIHIESAGDVEQILGAVQKLAQRHQVRMVTFPELHHCSDLAKHLRRGTARVHSHYVKSGQAMIRLLNLQSTLRKMRKELVTRLKLSSLRDWQGKLLIDNGKEKTVLGIDNCKVEILPVQPCKHAIHGGTEIAQLIIGTDAPFEITTTAQTKLLGDARFLLAILFPVQYPRLSRWDWF